MKRLDAIKNKGGFTLVELLVALTVLAIGLLGVLGMQVFAIRGNAFASNMTIAQNLAQQKLEYYKNFTYAALKGNTPPDTTVVFGTRYLSQESVPASILKAEDRLPVRINNDVAAVDVEDYERIMRDHNGAVLEDVDANGKNDPPFDRFRRVTIIKVIDGVSDLTDNNPDFTMVIKVLVFWKGPEGVESKVEMMTAKSLGG